MSFKINLTPEARKRSREYLENLEQQRAETCNLSDANLATSLELCAKMCGPVKFAPGEPVYDARLFHVILPEIARRLKER